jgi:hypothetical protein
MPRRVFQVPNYTPTATADTTNLANNTFMGIGAATTATGLRVSEIRVTGLATSTGVALMMFARDSTLGASLTALAAPASDGPANTLTGALSSPMLTFNFAGTSPQRSVATTAARLDLGLNTFGGISAWYGGPGEEWGIVGTAVNLSESSLSAFTGGSPGAIMSHIVYENI